MWFDNKETEINKCGECGAREGQLHSPGCEMERCPFCGGQLISCDCIYEMLGIVDKERWTEATDFLPPEVYQKGVSNQQWWQWIDICEQKGRWPYICYSQHCARCGQQSPGSSMAETELWEFAIQPDKRRTVVCKACMEYIVEATLTARRIAAEDAIGYRRMLAGPFDGESRNTRQPPSEDFELRYKLPMGESL
jgi:hypothetical protein